MTRSDGRIHPRRTRLLVIAALAASSAIAYACSGDAPTVPKPPVPKEIVCGTDTANVNRVKAGRYLVSSFDGGPLPRTLAGVGGHPLQVDWATATLNANGSYEIAMSQFWYGRDSTSRADHGTFAQCGSTIYFQSTQHASESYTAVATAATVTLALPASFVGAPGFRINVVLETEPCGGVGRDSIAVATGDYGLTAVGGSALPDTLPINYPSLVIVTSATASLGADHTYRMNGTVLSDSAIAGSADTPGDFGDEGTYDQCGSSVRLHSTTHAGYLYGSVSDGVLRIRFPAAFVRVYDVFEFGDSNDAFELQFSLAATRTVLHR